MVMKDGGGWKIWYTSFVDWGLDRESPRHRYLIKYGTSQDGIRWRRDNVISIDFADPTEFAICRPAVYFDGSIYHMWYCSRGEQYRLGYAVSGNGESWTRKDDAFKLEGSEEWDSLSQCYPSVFRAEDALYMLYCGNEYGRAGLGLARARLQNTL
jgi:hypothetical protein